MRSLCASLLEVDTLVRGFVHEALWWPSVGGVYLRGNSRLGGSKIENWVGGGGYTRCVFSTLFDVRTGEQKREMETDVFFFFSMDK